MDEVQKLHVKLKQEQQRWDKECVVREKQQVRLASLTLLCISSFPLLLIVTFPLVHANQELIKWGDKLNWCLTVGDTGNKSPLASDVDL